MFMGNRPEVVMKWLDGYKSYIGFIGYGVLHMMAAMWPDWAPWMMSVADYVMAPMAGVGLAHKLAKM